MRGLRTEENRKFLDYFELVQKEAARSGAVFFADCGMGDVTETDIIECEDLCGWMIPKAMAEEFDELFMNDTEEQHRYDEFYRFVDYELSDDGVKIIVQ